MNPRALTIILAVLLTLLQYPLWFGKGGFFRVNELSRQVDEQKAQNQTLKLRNQQLEGDVRSLKEGVEGVEERARNDFGMIKEGEVLIQLVDPQVNPSVQPEAAKPDVDNRLNAKPKP